jgi:DnaJ-domain-containing protein 1
MSTVIAADGIRAIALDELKVSNTGSQAERRAHFDKAAIAATLKAMRAIERHGGATILDRAFAGFKELPAPEQPWQVLGVSSQASTAEIDQAYKRLVAKHHPDRGGDEHTMARINAARDQLLGDHP